MAYNQEPHPTKLPVQTLVMRVPSFFPNCCFLLYGIWKSCHGTTGAWMLNPRVCLLENPLETKGFLRHPQSLQWYLEKVPVSARATHSCHFSPVGWKTEWTCLRTWQDFRSFLLWNVPGKKHIGSFQPRSPQKDDKTVPPAEQQCCRPMSQKWPMVRTMLLTLLKKRCGKSGKQVLVVWELAPETTTGPNF